MQITDDLEELKFCVECNSKLSTSWSELETPFCEECFFNTGID